MMNTYLHLQTVKLIYAVISMLFVSSTSIIAQPIANFSKESNGLTIENEASAKSERCTAPDLAINASMDTLCLGNTAILTVIGEADSFVWSTGETTSSIIAEPSETTVYSVTGFTDTCATSVQYIIYVEICTIVENLFSGKSIANIFPNPTSGETFINFNEKGLKALRLYDLSGREVLRINTVNDIESLNLFHLESGCYILNIERSGKAIESFKIIKH